MFRDEIKRRKKRVNKSFSLNAQILPDMSAQILERPTIVDFF